MIVISRWKLDDKPLGRGGFADVYRATHVESDQIDDVAIKILRQDLDHLDPTVFSDEAERALKLKECKGIANVLDHGYVKGTQTDFDGLPYIISEYVPGSTLWALAHDWTIPAALKVCSRSRSRRSYANGSPSNVLLAR